MCPRVSNIFLSEGSFTPYELVQSSRWHGLGDPNNQEITETQGFWDTEDTRKRTQEWGANHKSAGNKGRSFQAPGKRRQHGSDHTMPNTGCLQAQWSARSPYICLAVLLGIWYSFGSSSKGILTFIKWQSCVSCGRIILSPYFLRSTLCSQFERQKRTNDNGSSSGAGANNSSTCLSRYHSRSQLKGQLPRTGSTAEHLICCLSDLLVPSERDYAIPTYSFEHWVTARTQE